MAARAQRFSRPTAEAGVHPLADLPPAADWACADMADGGHALWGTFTVVAGAERCAGLIVSMVELGEGGMIKRGVPGCKAARAVCGRVISVVRVPVVGSV